MQGKMLHRLSILSFLAFLIVLIFPFPTYAAGFPIVGTLHSGRSPEAMAVDTQTHLLYIAHEDPGLIVAFDPLKGLVRWRVTLGDVATDVQVDSATHRVFVAADGYKNNEADLFILDGATGKILATLRTGLGDDGIALDTQRHVVYVSCSDNGIVYAFTVQTGWQNGSISTTESQYHIGSHPQGLGVNTRLGRLYVADIATHVLSILDESTMHTLSTVQLGRTPLHPLRVDEATSRVYIVCAGEQELDVLDSNKNTIGARIPVSPYPEGIAFNTATGRIYVADEGDDEGGHIHDIGTTITVIDSKTFDVLGTLSVGKSPDGVEADPALHLVYVALEDSNAVVEVSDSVNLPLQTNTKLAQVIAARNAVTLLQQATILTLIVMLLTVVWATLHALSPRWRAQENPQTPQGDASSRSKVHSLPR